MVLVSIVFQVFSDVFQMCFRCYDSDYLLIPMIVVLGFVTHTIVPAALQSQRVSVYKSLVVKMKLSSLVFLTITANCTLLSSYSARSYSRGVVYKVTLRLVSRSRLQTSALSSFG